MSHPPFFRHGRHAALSLTFDDARLSQIDRGMQILNAHGLRATFYVSPQNLSQRLDGWRQALGAGHEIGNHSLHHPCTGNFPWSRQRALEDYTLEHMEQELLSANDRIQELLGVTPLTFAYPCGQTFVGRGLACRSYVPLVARYFLAGRGFNGETTNDPRFCDLAQLFAYACDELDFDALRKLVDAAIVNGAWLILAGHDIGESGRQTTRLAALDALCHYCHERRDDLWIDTVASIASYIARVRGGHSSGEEARSLGR